MKPLQPSMQDLAARITVHLRRLEKESCIDPQEETHCFYEARASYPGGSKLILHYVSYHGSHALTRAEAILYLAALDAGSTEQHFQVLQKPAQAARRI